MSFFSGYQPRLIDNRWWFNTFFNYTTMRLHCPIETLLPMIVDAFIRAMNNRSILNIYFIAYLNEIYVSLMTALNQTLQDSPKLTSPTIVAFSAT
jgi:hypothetical protein